VPADPQDDSWGSVSAGPYSGWNNAPAGISEEITAPISSASIGPFLASKITFPTEIPYYSFDFLVEPMKLEPPSRFNFYGKNPTEEGGTQLSTELHQSRCWLEISPKQISATAQKISVLHISTYWSTNSSFVPPAVFPPDTSNPPWIPFAAKVVQFEFPPGQSFSSPLDMDQQLIGDGENISVTSSSYLENVTVKWRAVEGSANVSDHMDPWSEQVNGTRIFPEFKNPADTELRHKIEVIVKVPVSLKGQPVFVKAFDVDDTTLESFDRAGDGTTNPIIDIHGKAGGDNLPDYLGTPQAGQFWTGSTWGGATAQGIVDENGEAKFIFRVGMQPGNNYRVVASVIDQKMFEGVQVTDSSAAGFLGTDFLQSGGAPATPLLTVWRRLWVENDSMEKIPTHTFGYKKNDLSADIPNPIIDAVSLNAAGTDTIFTISPISDPTSFLNLENGHIFVRSVGHPVTGAGILNGDHVVSVAGNYTSVLPGSAFRLYDDDDFGLNRDSLPRTDLVDEVVQKVYRKAFIEVVDAERYSPKIDYNPDKHVSFHKNHPAVVPYLSPLHLVWEDSKNCHDRQECWVGNLVAGYQNSHEDDADPRLEEGSDGLTPESSRRFSIVYVETVRDTAADSGFRDSPNRNKEINERLVIDLKLTVAHELGHMPGGQSGVRHHNELQLMGEGGASFNENGETFSAKTVSRFRRTRTWQQPTN
jgi:hypothetical protein